jgi:hypothetical protein
LAGTTGTISSPTFVVKFTVAGSLETAAAPAVDGVAFCGVGGVALPGD